MRFLILMLALACAAPSAPGEGRKPADPSSAQASNELALLRAQVRAQELELRRLREENDRLSRFLVAPADPGGATWRGGSIPAASSGLQTKEAQRLAQTLALLVPDSTVSLVTPTKSMVPVFDSNAFVLLEKTRYQDLRVGDIVTFRHPNYPLPIVHRIVEKRGDRFWTKGDGNVHMDDVYLTQENFLQRVFAIVYANEG
jgi:hypothetical protein